MKFYPTDLGLPRFRITEPFDWYGSLRLAASSSGQLLYETVPSGIAEGYITGIGQYIEDTSKFDENSLWTLSVTNLLDPKWNNFTIWLGHTNDPQPIRPILIREGYQITVSVINNHASGFLYSARLIGFYNLGAAI